MEAETFLILLHNNHNKRNQYFPGKLACEEFAERLYGFLFLCNINDKVNTHDLSISYNSLKQSLTDLVNSTLNNKEQAEKIANDFFETLPGIYNVLLMDAAAILAMDPAAHNIEEVFVAYPGFFATVIYRFAHKIYDQGLFILARFFSEYAHSKTGIDIHPGATVGHSFAIDHGTGLVIGETTIIGEQVKIFQGVTLGALNVSKEKASTKRHPTIQDNVVIYAGATILGGDTTIGKGSIIGGNVWLTYSVPPNSVVYHKSEIHVKDNNPFPEPLNFVI